MKEFDKTSVKEINSKIKELLKPIETEYDIIISVRGCSYSKEQMKPRLELNFPGFKDGINKKQESDFTNTAHLYNLKAEDLGKTFIHKGHTWTIVGCTPNSPKLPILCQKDNGETYKFPAWLVVHCLDKK